MGNFEDVCGHESDQEKRELTQLEKLVLLARKQAASVLKDLIDVGSLTPQNTVEQAIKVLEKE